MGWQLYIAGLFSGVFLSFLLYLGTLPPTIDPATQATAGDNVPAKNEPPKPRFDFYTLLPEQSVERPTAPIDKGVPQSVKSTKNAEFYLLQTGSFKQREDADRRRAELILLGLEPNIEETNGDNGRWYRVYLGPFQSRAKLNKARSLTAARFSLASSSAVCLDAKTAARVALGIHVDQEDTLSLGSQGGREVHSRGCLAHAALLVGHGNHPRGPRPFLIFHNAIIYIYFGDETTLLFQLSGGPSGPYHPCPQQDHENIRG